MSREGCEACAARTDDMTNPESFVERAEAHRREGRYEEAISICREGLRITPEALRGRLILGMCYLEKGLPAEAKRELEKVAEGVEECLPVFKVLSQLYLQEKNVNLSTEEKNPGEGFTPLEMSVEEQRAKWKSISEGPDLEEGLAGQGQALIENSMPKVMHTDTLAEIYLKQGHLQKALVVYQEILTREPGNCEVRDKYERLRKKLSADQRAASKRKVIRKLERLLTAVGPQGNSLSL